MIKNFNFRLNIPQNVWMLLLVIVLVIVVMTRCNREGFGYNIMSSNSSDFIKVDNVDSLENKYAPFEKNVCGPIVPGQFFFGVLDFLDFP